MTGCVASPATAWTTNQRVVMADSAPVHWSGSAWVAGAAASATEAESSSRKTKK